MKARYLIAAAAALAVGIAGCDRNEPSTQSNSINLQQLPAQAERAVEEAGAALDDAAVTAMVKTALIAEPNVKGLAIEVDTLENTVTLSGAVASNELREEAERISRSVQGVKGVKNNLIVKQAS